MQHVDKAHAISDHFHVVISIIKLPGGRILEKFLKSLNSRLVLEILKKVLGKFSNFENGS